MELSLTSEALLEKCKQFNCVLSTTSSGYPICGNQKHINDVLVCLVLCYDEEQAAALIKNICVLFANARLFYLSTLSIAAKRGWNRLCLWMIRLGADIEPLVYKGSDIFSSPYVSGIISHNYGTALFLAKYILRDNYETTHLLSRSQERLFTLIGRLKEYSGNFSGTDGCSLSHILPDYVKDAIITGIQINPRGSAERKKQRGVKELKNTISKHIIQYDQDMFQYDELPNVRCDGKQIKNCYAKFEALLELQETLKFAEKEEFSDEDSADEDEARAEELYAQAADSMHETDNKLVHVDFDYKYSALSSHSSSEPNTAEVFTPLGNCVTATSVYVLGENANYNLGQGGSRKKPRLMEQLSHLSDNKVVQVSMSDNHTLFLMASGNVKACGLGTGGRLGTGSQAPSVRPENVSFQSGLKIKMVAAGSDNSVFLTTCDQLFACGLNDHGILGDKSLNKDYSSLSPRRIKWSAPLKNGTLSVDTALGVVSSDVHCAVWTSDRVYTWGRSLGQLGHDQETVDEPKVIDSLIQSSGIYIVSVSNNATVIGYSNGSLFLIKNNSVRKISSSMGCIQKIICYRAPTFIESTSCYANSTSDGAPNFLQDVFPRSSVIFAPKKHLLECDLVLFVLVQSKLFMWHSDCKKLFEITPFPIKDFVATATTVLAVRPDGRIAEIHVATMIEYKTGRNLQFMDVPCFDLPYVQNNQRIYSSPSLNNFVFLLNDKHDYHFIESIVLKDHLFRNFENSLLNKSDVHDDYYDVILKCNGAKFRAHKVILASMSLFFRRKFGYSVPVGEELKEWIGGTKNKLDNKTKCCQSKNNSSIFLCKLKLSPVTCDTVELDNIEPKVLEELLCYIYRGVCEHLLYPSKELINCKYYTKEQPTNLEVGNFASALKYKAFSLKVARAAYYLGLHKFFSFGHSLVYPTLNIVSIYPMNQDVVFLCYDKEIDDDSPGGHKFILITRIEYFSVLFCTRWSSSQQVTDKNGRFIVELRDYSQAAVRLLLQYVYTDHICLCKASLTLAQELFILADQVLCVPARILAEKAISHFIGVHNYSSLYEFAYQRSAKLLLYFLDMYMCYHLPLVVDNIDCELACADRINAVSQTFTAGIYSSCFGEDTSRLTRSVVPLPGISCNSKVNLAQYERRYTGLTHYLSQEKPNLFESITDSLHKVDYYQSNYNKGLIKFGYETNKKRRRRRSRMNSSRSSESSDTDCGLNCDPTGSSQEPLDFTGLVDKSEIDVEKELVDSDETNDEKGWVVVAKKSKNKFKSYFENLFNDVCIYAMASPYDTFSPPDETVHEDHDNKKLETKGKTRKVTKSVKENIHSEKISNSSTLNATNISDENVQQQPLEQVSESIPETKVEEIPSSRNTTDKFTEEFPVLGSSSSKEKPLSRSAPKSSNFSKLSQKSKKKLQMEQKTEECSKSSTPAWNIPSSSRQDSDQVEASSADMAVSASFEEPSKSLASIMRNERNKQTNLKKAQEKGFSKILEEEKAMAELTQHYRALGSPEDIVSVSRVTPTDAELSSELRWTSGKNQSNL